MNMDEIQEQQSYDSEKENEVFEEDPQEETSIRIQRNYKDLIRKLEDKHTFDFTQGRLSSIAVSPGNDSQFGLNERNTMKRLMDEAHDLYKGVQGPHEARLDARVLKQVSKICSEHAQALSVNQQKFQVS